MTKETERQDPDTDIEASVPQQNIGAVIRETENVEGSDFTVSHWVSYLKQQVGHDGTQVPRYTVEEALKVLVTQGVSPTPDSQIVGDVLLDVIKQKPGTKTIAELTIDALGRVRAARAESSSVTGYDLEIMPKAQQAEIIRKMTEAGINISEQTAKALADLCESLEVSPLAEHGLNMEALELVVQALQGNKQEHGF